MVVPDGLCGGDCECGEAEFVGGVARDEWSGDGDAGGWDDGSADCGEAGGGGSTTGGGSGVDGGVAGECGTERVAPLGVVAGGVRSREVEKKCEEKGVLVSGGNWFAAPGTDAPRAVRLGLGGEVEFERAMEGVRVFAGVVRG